MFWFPRDFVKQRKFTFLSLWGVELFATHLFRSTFLKKRKTSKIRIRMYYVCVPNKAVDLLIPLFWEESIAGSERAEGKKRPRIADLPLGSQPLSRSFHYNDLEWQQSPWMYHYMWLESPWKDGQRHFYY